MKNHEKKYPAFYAAVQKENNKKKNKRLIIKDGDIKSFNCPMDIIYDLVEKGVIDLRKQKDLNVRTDKESEGGVRKYFEYKADKVNVNRKQFQKVVSIVQEYERFVRDEISNEERSDQFKKCLNKLKKLTIKSDTMYALINYAFIPGNEKIRDSLLVALYDQNDNKQEFLKFFKKT